MVCEILVAMLVLKKKTIQVHVSNVMATSICQNILPSIHIQPFRKILISVPSIEADFGRSMATMHPVNFFFGT